jgi:hypothetical protein
MYYEFEFEPARFVHYWGVYFVHSLWYILPLCVLLSFVVIIFFAARCENKKRYYLLSWLGPIGVCIIALLISGVCAFVKAL